MDNRRNRFTARNTPPPPSGDKANPVKRMGSGERAGDHRIQFGGTERWSVDRHFSKSTTQQIRDQLDNPDYAIALDNWWRRMMSK